MGWTSFSWRQPLVLPWSLLRVDWVSEAYTLVGFIIFSTLLWV
jgi:hypothetical protein